MTPEEHAICLGTEPTHTMPGSPQPPPEIALLLGVARASLLPEGVERLRSLLGGKLEWDRVISLAEYHGLLPLLYWHLSQNLAAQAPSAVLFDLEGRFRHNAMRNLWRTGELLRILDLLSQNGIRAVPYKGPALASSLYGNPALREFYDLDLFLQAEDFPRAKEILLSAGYQPELSLTPSQERALLRSDCEYNFQSHDQATRLEVHWQVAPWHMALSLDTGPWTQRLERSALEGASVFAFSPPDLLLILCVHGGKHCWQSLIWIADVAELLQAHPDLDWREALHQARRAGAERLLLLGLFLAHDLLAAPLQHELQQRVEHDPEVRFLAGRVVEHLFASRTSRTAWEAFRFLQRSRERSVDRWRYLLRTVLTPTPAEWSVAALPAALFPLYVLLRLFRLGGKYSALAWRRWFHHPSGISEAGRN